MNLLGFPGSAFGLVVCLAMIATTSARAWNTYGKEPDYNDNYESYNSYDDRPYNSESYNAYESRPYNYESNYEYESPSYRTYSSDYSPEEYGSYGRERREYGDNYRTDYRRRGGYSESCESDEDYYDRGYNYRRGYNKAERKSYGYQPAGYRVVYPGSGYDDKYNTKYVKEKEYEPKKRTSYSYRRKAVKKAKYPQTYNKNEYKVNNKKDVAYYRAD